MLSWHVPKEAKSDRRERRRLADIDYRKRRADARAPDTRAIASAVLALIVAEPNAKNIVRPAVDRLSAAGYDEVAAREAIEALISRSRGS